MLLGAGGAGQGWRYGREDASAETQCPGASQLRTAQGECEHGNCREWGGTVDAKLASVFALQEMRLWRGTSRFSLRQFPPPGETQGQWHNPYYRPLSPAFPAGPFLQFYTKDQQLPDFLSPSKWGGVQLAQRSSQSQKRCNAVVTPVMPLLS